MRNPPAVVFVAIVPGITVNSPNCCRATTFGLFTPTSIPSMLSKKSIPSSSGSNSANLSLSMISVGGMRSSPMIIAAGKS